MKYVEEEVKNTYNNRNEIKNKEEESNHGMNRFKFSNNAGSTISLEKKNVIIL